MLYNKVFLLLFVLPSCLILVEVYTFCFVFVIIVGEHSYESCNLLYSILCAWCYFFLLQAEHHHSVESIETGFYLVDIFVATIAELNDKWQYLIIFSRIEWKLWRLQQLSMKLCKTLYHDFVYLQMSFLAASFLVHHIDEVAPPVNFFVHLFF